LVTVSLQKMSIKTGFRVDESLLKRVGDFKKTEHMDLLKIIQATN